MSRPRTFASSHSFSAARLGVIGLAALCFGGCASKQASYDPPARVAGPAASQVQGPWQVKVEIEDDGLPSQLAPRHRPPVEDDPTQPWSPNYGKKASAKVVAEPAAAAPGLRTKPLVRQQVTAMDEDAIIRRAIAEHEMRRQE